MNDSSPMREHPRIPVSMEVEFRTTGSFLVSYALNLSKGGLFIETDTVLPIGSQITVRFMIPGDNTFVEATAQVVWVRPRHPDGKEPPGLGLQFEHLEDHLGDRIDDMVQRFSGVKLLAVSRNTQTQERLARSLEHVMTCEVLKRTPEQILASGFPERVELALVDLDESHAQGLAVIEQAAREPKPLPIVAISKDDNVYELANQLGVALALKSFAYHRDLRHQLLSIIAKPNQSTAVDEEVSFPEDSREEKT